MKEKQNAKINLLHKANSKDLEICLHTWNFLMTQECTIMLWPVKMTSRLLWVYCSSCSSSLTVLPCKALRWEGFQSENEEEKHLQRSPIHSSAIHSQPKQVPQLFSMTQALGFFQELMSGLFMEKELHWQGRQGRRASPAPSQCALCAALLLGPAPCKNFESPRNSAEGRAQGRFQQPELFFHSWLISKAQKQQQLSLCRPWSCHTRPFIVEYPCKGLQAAKLMKTGEGALEGT